MALKDLVMQTAALTEDLIEKIVQQYVRYDAEEKEIDFTPEFAALSNKAKVLIYLVALQGWRFVDDTVGMEAKPSAIESKLGIPGGTLRPLLRELNQGHLVSTKDGSYSVRPSSLDAIRKECGEGSGSSAVRTRRRKERGKSSSVANGSGDAGASVGPAKDDKKRAGFKEIGDHFNRWIEKGFFDNGRGLAELQARFHEEAIILPQSSIPKYLLKAVRAKRLARRKEDRDGKERWIYRTLK